MSELVIRRDEYKVGMTVRLRNGETHTLHTGDVYGEIVTNDGWYYSEDGTCCGSFSERDIIGEVVANTAAPEVATPKRADFMTYEKRVYSDDMFVANGMVDCMSMAELVENRRYYDRAISRLKATAKHYGWEV